MIIKFLHSDSSLRIYVKTSLKHSETFLAELRSNRIGEPVLACLDDFDSFARR